MPPRLLAALESRPGVLIVRWSVRVLFALSILAWFVMGADGPDDPYFEGDDSGAPRRVPVDGFGEVALRVEPGRGDRARLFCALHAATDTARVQGMQRRDDLSGYDAMVFTFDADSNARFVNHYVPIDLSIAWFDAEGRFVSSAEMPACPGGQNCPTYAAVAPYRTAVEVPRGGLRDLGVRPGSRVTVGGTCA